MGYIKTVVSCPSLCLVPTGANLSEYQPTEGSRYSNKVFLNR